MSEQQIEIHSAVGMQGDRKLHFTIYDEQRRPLVETELDPGQIWGMLNGGVVRAQAEVYRDGYK
jgi:hypothetical protein